MPARYTNTSKLSGVTRTIEYSQYTQEEFERRLSSWKQRRVMIQEAFPELSEDGREFIMTGITKEEWDKEFGE